MDKISKKKPAPEGVGYKVFSLTDGRLYGDLARRDKVRPVGTWLNSRNYSVRSKESYVSPIRGRYPVGWHIYKSMVAAKDWIGNESLSYCAIKRVKYRQAHTEGTTFGYKVVVAKEIYIIP